MKDESFDTGILLKAFLDFHKFLFTAFFIHAFVTGFIVFSIFGAKMVPRAAWKNSGKTLVNHWYRQNKKAGASLPRHSTIILF